MLIHNFTNGDTLIRKGNAIIACFNKNRNVLGTSPLNGGYRNDLTNVFNYDCKSEIMAISHDQMPTYREQLMQINRKLGFDDGYVTGMSTAASMDHVAIRTASFQKLEVTAVVTAGIDYNGGRAGDEALWHETDGQYRHVPGTINIMLFINANLPAGSMARAMITATEAKTAALQELLVPSCYSSGLATGSGTDGMIIISDPYSPDTLLDAGKHTKLGELIGRTVITAVKEALWLETGLCGKRQFHLISRLKRFGITCDSLWEKSTNVDITKDEFIYRMNELSVKPDVVIYASLFAHVLDQITWGLIEEKDGVKTCRELLLHIGLTISAGIENVDEMIKVFSEEFALKVYDYL